MSRNSRHPKLGGLSANTQLCTAEEEVELLARVKAGDAEARDEIVTRNLPLAAKVAGQLFQDVVPLEDKYQAGVIGLIEAADRFDLEKRVRFSTYAYWWVRMRIYEACKDHLRMVVTSKEIKRYEYRERYETPRSTKKVSVLHEKPIGRCAKDGLVCSREMNPVDHAIFEEAKRDYEQYMKCLNVRDRALLRRTLCGETGTQVGKKFGLSKQRVHQRLKRCKPGVSEVFQKHLDMEVVL